MKCCKSPSVLSLVVSVSVLGLFLLAGSVWSYSQEPKSFVIAGSVRFENDDPAGEVEIWLRTSRGAPATRITKTLDDGSFKFELPPPAASKFKLLVVPYGIEYANIGPSRAEFPIVVPGTKATTFGEYIATLNEKGRMLVFLKYEAFVAGISSTDEKNAPIFRRVGDEIFPAIAKGQGYDVSLQSFSPTGPWYELKAK